MKHLTVATYRPSRTDNERVIRMLCEHYPKCFSEEPKQRRPLKPDIAADIVRDDDFAVAPEMITAADRGLQADRPERPRGWYGDRAGGSVCQAQNIRIQ
jgi:hypothetical protein